MIETLLALVPTYGLWVVACSVALSCLALPLPSSVLVMAAGGFAAAGDLHYGELVLATFAGFVVGDQAVYALARRGGPPLVALLTRRPRAATVLESAQALIDRHGVLAIFLSRTLLSPLCAWVSCLCGALRFGWARYSVAAALGALCWSIAYSYLGYAFAGYVLEIALVIGHSIGFVLSGVAVAALLWWLLRGARSTRRDRAAAAVAAAGEDPIDSSESP